uniref:Uncharacterized protein n=1 Tax=Caenorhabditis japonica TaxID=281687 RepID=A0A8R1DNW5_CAEJA
MGKKAACKKFMFKNVSIRCKTVAEDVQIEGLTKRKMTEVVRGYLEKIGFRLPSDTKIEIGTFGEMPDSCPPDLRFWTTFELNQSGAEAIRHQRNGKNDAIWEWNIRMFGHGSHHKYLTLRQFRGSKFAAIRSTMKRAAEILSKTTWPEVDGFNVIVVDNQIIVRHEDIFAEKLTIETIFDEHRVIFDNIIKNLSIEDHEEMLQLSLELEKTSPLRKCLFPDQTKSLAATPPSFSPPKKIKLLVSPIRSYSTTSLD